MRDKKAVALVLGVTTLVADLVIGFLLMFLWVKLFGTELLSKALVLFTFISMLYFGYKQEEWMKKKWREADQEKRGR